MNAEAPRALVIEAGRAESQYWRDLWRCRELLFFLTWRDIVVRYKQTVFGVAWTWMQPMLTMLTFTVVFGKLAKMPSDNLPYSIMVFMGILPWSFFSNAFNGVANSMISSSNLISKVYFPRLIVPISTIMVSLVDMLISAVLLAVLMAWHGVWPDARILFLPFFLLLTFVFCLGSGLLVAALNVRYRDFRYVIPFSMQFLMYASPVGFSSSVVPQKWRLLYSINPMVGIIDGFRWSLGGGRTPIDVMGLCFSCLICGAFLVCGIRYFRKTEKTFADVI